MLTKPTLFHRELALLVVIVIIDATTRVWVSALALTSRGCTKCVKLSRQLGLRLDEGAAVVAHWLVPGVGVLGEKGESRGDK